MIGIDAAIKKVDVAEDLVNVVDPKNAAKKGQDQGREIEGVVPDRPFKQGRVSAK